MWSNPLKDLTSYQANFKQTIIDETGSRIIYRGTFFAKQPNYALWHYDSPVKKDVYIFNKDITIVEPELEQVIYKKNMVTFTLFSVIKKAKQKDKNTYVHTIDDIEYKLLAQNKTLKKLTYLDTLGNQVEIVFSKQYPNKSLKNAKFHAKYPSDFDIISE